MKVKVFQISPLAEDQYKGAGHAIVAISDNEVVKVVYIKDVLGAEYRPSGDDELADFTLDDLKGFIGHPKTLAAGDDLKRYGSVHFGMLSNRAFVEL